MKPSSKGGRAVCGASFVLCTLLGATQALASQETSRGQLRARELGVPFDGMPGPLNAITDVPGVEVGHVTLVSGSGKLVIGEGPVRTGVSAVLPRGRADPDPVFAAWFALNGNGEMTGTIRVEDYGMLKGPIMLTNTLSVGIVHHAVIRWGIEKGGEGLPFLAGIPMVAETYDGRLNDIAGQHVTEADAIRAIEGARGGPVAEGNVGGGTGMICYEFKGGIGTSSRVVEVDGERYTVGALVQCNYGYRHQLRIAGVPVGREIPEPMPQHDGRELGTGPSGSETGSSVQGSALSPDFDRSIIVVIGTDAALLPNQLELLARRVSLGLARLGAISTNTSGDIFVAFSTANREAARAAKRTELTVLPKSLLNPLFTATVEATEEAVVNALIAAETMTGADGLMVPELDEERLRSIFRSHGRLGDKTR
ncbi:MAG: P1 family peptidase [Gemmatimonadetes bacterium]|nr:P1 family peptidase [Gemmatimonadota bacterium]